MFFFFRFQWNIHVHNFYYEHDFHDSMVCHLAQPFVILILPLCISLKSTASADDGKGQASYSRQVRAFEVAAAASFFLLWPRTFFVHWPLPVILPTDFYQWPPSCLPSFPIFLTAHAPILLPAQLPLHAKMLILKILLYNAMLPGQLSL